MRKARKGLLEFHYRPKGTTVQPDNLEASGYSVRARRGAEKSQSPHIVAEGFQEAEGLLQPVRKSLFISTTFNLLLFA
jgi:hypothetical protein